jgi:hypothetical protein
MKDHVNKEVLTIRNGVSAIHFGPDWRFWGDMEQDILKGAGKVKFYFTSGSYEDFETTKTDDIFYDALRDRIMDFLGRLVKYNAWANTNYNRWTS